LRPGKLRRNENANGQFVLAVNRTPYIGGFVDTSNLPSSVASEKAAVLDTNPGTNGKPAVPDPFDPAALRLSQDTLAALGVKKVLVTIPVRKPEKSWFVRVHPDETYRLQTAVVELKENRGETYLVAQHLWPELAGEATFSPRMLFLAVNRQGVPFLWPVRLPGPDGKLDQWSKSALAAADMAVKNWVRVAANMGLGAYEIFQATGDLPAPKWPELPFNEILRIAFKDQYIDTPEHPVLRALRGEV
jgi:hypothetical protein